MADESALPPARHESTDVGERVIWIGMPLLIVVVVGLALLVFWLFPGQTTDRTLQLPLPRYPTPQLQVSPRDDMSNFLARELHWLNSSGWVDKQRGIVHIPIDEAMRRVAQEGIAGWPGAAEAPQAANPPRAHGPTTAPQPPSQHTAKSPSP
jgi:hypothetical protein